WLFLLLTAALFIIEVLIARYSHSGFIRGFAGDVLVVLLLFCAVRSVLRIPVIPLAVLVLLFAYLIELGQWFGLVDLLGLGQYRLARIVIGSHFDWWDLVAYSTGFVIICLVYHYRQRGMKHAGVETGNYYQ
ncbi:MAG: DUF2809 domain-containing protein, partial [Plesiomonas shigelloides]